MSSRGSIRGARVNERRDQSGAAGGRTYVAPEAGEHLRAWFGRDLTEGEVRRMVGAPPDASVRVAVDREYTIGSGPELKFQVRGAPVPVQRYDITEQREVTVHMPLIGGYGAEYPAERILRRSDDGHLEMENAVMRVLPEYQGQGVGLRMFATEAKTLSELRDAHGQRAVGRIGADMAGHKRSSDQGYRIWPLMGYNTRPGALGFYYKQLVKDKSVTAATRAAVKRLGPKLTVLDLYALGPEARGWWREHGVAEAGFFDLTPGSRSMQVLRNYVASKGIDWEAL